MTYVPDDDRAAIALAVDGCRALAAAGRDVKYYPVDASQQLLETACAGAEDDEIEALGIKADISSPMHMVLAPSSSWFCSA